MSKQNDSNGWSYLISFIVLLIIGINWGIGPFRGAKQCSSSEKDYSEISVSQSPSQSNYSTLPFTGRREDRLETGVNNTCLGKHCRCRVTGSSLRKNGYSTCPMCGHSTTDHRD